MSFIFILFMLTFVFAFFLFLLFLFLLVRKGVMHYIARRNRNYERFIYPLISRYITVDNHFQHRLLQQSKKWKRAILARMLLDISTNIQSDEEWRRVEQACALIGLTNELRSQLQDKRWWKAAEAIRNIGILKLKELLPLVEDQLLSPQYDVRMTTARTLSMHGRNRVLIEYLIQESHRLQRVSIIRIADILRKVTEEDVDLMLANMNRISPLLQGLFIDLFGRARSMKALPYLETCLSSSSVELRIKALKAMADIGIVSNQDEIMHGLRSDNWVERMQTIRVIQACSMYSAIPQLLDKLADPEWWVRYRAAEALFGFGSVGKDNLRWASKHHHDSYAKDMADQMLTKWHPEEAAL
ncbi:HEAT repeat domain-containing protein [Paenibacillus tarimensis]